VQSLGRPILVWVRIPARRPALLTEGFRDFLQSPRKFVN